MSVHSYPVHLDLRGRRVLVVGAGRIAAGKLDRLLETGAELTVVAPAAQPSIENAARHGALTWHRRMYARGEVASYRLGISATGDPAVDGQVYRDGEAIGVWVNAADDLAHCAFTLPAVARRGSISVAIGTEGRSPALASFLRRRSQAELDDGLEALLGLLADARSELRMSRGTTEHPGWREALDSGLLDVVRGGDLVRAQHDLRVALELPLHHDLDARASS